MLSPRYRSAFRLSQVVSPALVLLLLPLRPSHAQELPEAVKVQLRAAAPAPELSFSTAFNIGTNGFILPPPGSLPTPQARIQELLLEKTPEDKEKRAAHLLELAQKYSEIGKEDDAKANFAKADALFRELLKGKPKARWRYLIGLDMVAYGLHKDNTERELILRDAAEDAPKHWEVWFALGNLRSLQAFSSLTGGLRPKPESYIFSPESFPDDCKPTPEQLKQARAQLQDAKKFCDRAVQLGPKSVAAHLSRFFLSLFQGQVEHSRLGPEADTAVLVQKFLLSDETIDDFECIVQAVPEQPVQPVGIMMVTVMKAMRAIILPQGRAGLPPMNASDALDALFSEDVDTLPAAPRKELEQGVERLIKIGKDTSRDKTIRAEAYEAAGTLQALDRDRKQAEETLKQALLIYPARTSAFQALIGMLMDRDAWSDIASLSEARIALFPDEEKMLRIYIACAAIGMQKDNQAADQYRLVLAKSPADVMALSGMATLRMKQSGSDPKALEEAGNLLMKVPSGKEVKLTTDEWVNDMLALSLYYALTGKKSDAVSFLKQVQDRDEGGESVDKLLKLLE